MPSGRLDRTKGRRFGAAILARLWCLSASVKLNGIAEPASSRPGSGTAPDARSIHGKGRRFGEPFSSDDCVIASICFLKSFSKLSRLKRSSFWGNSFRESQVADFDSGLVALLIGWMRRKVEDLGEVCIVIRTAPSLVPSKLPEGEVVKPYPYEKQQQLSSRSTAVSGSSKGR